MNLAETRVEVTVIFKKKCKENKRVKVLTYRCVDDFVDEDDFLPSYDEFVVRGRDLNWAI